MGAVFHSNNRFIDFFSNVANLIILNLLWILCCIPIVTIVPSTAAMYYVTLKMVKKEDPYIIRSFFRSFRDNFKQGVVLSVIFLVLAGVLYADIKILQKFSSEFHQVLLTVSYVVCALGFITMAYVCPLLSYFQNTVAATLKNAVILALTHPLKTVILLIMNLLPFLLLMFFPDVFALSLFLWAVLGFSSIALVNSTLLSKLFKKYEPKELTEVADRSY